ncbi:lipase family protein [Oligoflexia bacterium]|nr:lipase family protein [Oligoflexia bacterium]
MEIDKSWEALRNPGVSDRFFMLEDLPRFAVADLESDTFNLELAWLLAEISRLIYKKEANECSTAAFGVSRKTLLSKVGLEEILFVNQGGTQCSILKSIAKTPQAIGILVFRGTQNIKDWITNLDTALVPSPSGGMIHKGFLKALEAVWITVEGELDKIKAPLLFTGHSLGGALATAAASVSSIKPHAVYTFGAPRIGNVDFNATLAAPLFRIVNDCDMVPTLPPRQLGFRHPGVLMQLTESGELLANPGKASVYIDRIRGFFDLEDLGTQLQTLDPHKMLWKHAPINYVALLEQMLGDIPMRV